MRRRKVVFVRGCFWHGHSRARGARLPKQNAEYWLKKIARNKERDATHLATLKELGWSSLIIWECELKEPENVARRLSEFVH